MSKYESTSPEYQTSSYVSSEESSNYQSNSSASGQCCRRGCMGCPYGEWLRLKNSQ